MDYERFNITSSEEYHEYLSALCQIASEYVSRIRVQFAKKAFEMYQDKTVRKLVIECGKEYEKLLTSRMFDFKLQSEKDPELLQDDLLEDTCLNNYSKYARTVFFLFDID